MIQSAISTFEAHLFAQNFSPSIIYIFFALVPSLWFTYFRFLALLPLRRPFPFYLSSSLSPTLPPCLVFSFSFFLLQSTLFTASFALNLGFPSYYFLSMYKIMCSSKDMENKKNDRANTVHKITSRSAMNRFQREPCRTAYHLFSDKRCIEELAAAFLRSQLVLQLSSPAAFLKGF